MDWKEYVEEPYDAEKCQDEPIVLRLLEEHMEPLVSHQEQVQLEHHCELHMQKRPVHQIFQSIAQQECFQHNKWQCEQHLLHPIQQVYAQWIMEVWNQRHSNEHLMPLEFLEFEHHLCQ